MRRVLITRSPHQASELAERLRALNIEPILIPTIELAAPTTFASLDAALARLTSKAAQPAFHWLLFTSANAVQAFHRRLLSNHPNSVAAEQDHSPGGEPVPQGFSLGSHRSKESGALAPGVCLLPERLKIAAIGPATARALATLGYKLDLVPPQAIAESLAAALLPHAHQPDATPTRFLLIRAEAARDPLPDALRAAGADITIAPAYRTIIPAGSITQLQSLFANRESWPDAITFTSSSTATNLQALLEASSLTLPPEILRISIGPITSQTLRDLKLPPHAEAETPTVEALATAAARALGLAS